MADSERSKIEKTEAEAPGKPLDELDQLLQRIATHIADVDKAAASHGQATGAPEAPDASTAGAPAAAVSTRPASDPTPGAALQRTGGLRRLRIDGEPPALRSALAGSASAAALPKQTPQVEAEVPPARVRSGGDIAEVPAAGEPSATDEIWDSDAAEALTRTYEAEAAVPPLRSMLNIMAQPGGGGSGRQFAGASAFGEAMDNETAQVRLFEAAQRVEAMLDRLAPREAIDSLGVRFDSLEQEVRASGERIARLDDIEHRLDDLGQKLSDDNIVALFGPLVPTAEDLSQYAEDAAGRAAERVLEAYAREITPPHGERDGLSPASGGELKALGEMLGNFMDERRRSDAGTLEALETLQLAMQHLLDRIDQGAGPVEDADPVPPRNSAPAPREDRVAAPLRHDDLTDDGDLVHSEFDEAPSGVVNLTANQGPSSLTADAYRMPQGGLRDSDDHPDVAAHRQREPRLPGGQMQPPFAEDRDAEPYMPPIMMDARDDYPRRGEPEQGPDASPVNDRQAMIARARQAAGRASADPAQKGQADKAARIRKGDGNAASLLPAGIIRPGVLVVAIAAIVFAGYWLLFGQTPVGPQSSAPAVMERQVPAEAVAKGDQPDIEPEALQSGNGAVQDATPPAPSKMSDDTPQTAPAAHQQDAKAEPRAEDATGPGMAIAFGASPATVETVVQARERSRLANLSQRTAFGAVRSHAVSAAVFADPAPAPAAVPASVPAPHASAAAKTSAIETASVPLPRPGVLGTGEERQRLALPPATSGPLSLRMAAAQGDAAAQLEIATRLAEGKGVRQNFAEAAKWYDYAATQGQPIAQYRLATLYERGMGVKADRNKAKALYEAAAQQGNLKAMHNLAVIAASPAAGSPDYSTAAKLFERAARHGLHDSQYNLGVLYESGLGVPKDHAAAYKWYKLAAVGGDVEAARRRDLLISRLPPETLQAIEAQTAAWRPDASDERANNARLVGSTWSQR